MLIRRYESTDADRVRDIHAKAFRRIDAPDAIPPEVALFDALVGADDVIPQLSLVTVGDADPVGHVMCSRATVEARAVAALAPISVDPRNQRQGVGRAMMHAVLSAAEALDVPLVGLLGVGLVLLPHRIHPRGDAGYRIPVPRAESPLPGPDSCRIRLLDIRPLSLAPAFDLV